MIDFERLFNPMTIGIIGANEKRFGGGYFLQSLLNIGFDRKIYLFNPRLKGKTLYGLEVYGSILEIPENEPIDYVIIAVPAKYCPKVVEECGKKKVPFVTIFTSGFSEVGNHDLEKEIIEVAKKYKTRIIGPNCLGVFVPKIRLTFSLTLLKERYGNLGMIFQSGGLAVYIAAMGQSVYGTYPSKVISIGNQIDLNFVDFLEYFIKDNETKIIALYLENIKNPEIGKKFLKVVRQLSLDRKPVILWKVGSGEATREAIVSHTGGLAGSLSIWKAVAKQTGALLVNNSHELINLAMIFQHISSMPLNRNMGITAVGGGASIETTDVFERYNLRIPKLTPKTAEKFKEFLPDVNTIIRNPLDLGGSGADPEIFYKTLITLDSDPNISAVIFIKVYDFNHSFLEAIKKAYNKMKKPLICIAYKVIDDTSDYAGKLLFKKELFKLKVPVFESIELAAKSIDKMCAFREFQEQQEKYKKDLISSSLM
ncbi:MAG: CoA-binding protein [Promethearchaeota archaeon]